MVDIMQSFMVVVWLLIFKFIHMATSEQTQTILRVVNHGGEPVDVYWISTLLDDEPRVRQSAKPIRNGTDFSVHFFTTSTD